MEPTFPNYPGGAPISGIVPAPDAAEAQVRETVLQNGLQRLRHQPLAPVAGMKPVADLIVGAAGLLSGGVAAHIADGPQSAVVFLQFHGENTGQGEYVSNDGPAFLHALMRRPARDGANAGIGGIGEDVLRVLRGKRPENQACCFNLGQSNQLSSSVFSRYGATCPRTRGAHTAVTSMVAA